MSAHNIFSDSEIGKMSAKRKSKNELKRLTSKPAVRDNYLVPKNAQTAMLVKKMNVIFDQEYERTIVLKLIDTLEAEFKKSGSSKNLEVLGKKFKKFVFQFLFFVKVL